MADRSVSVKLRAETSQYMSAMDGAAKATDKVGGSAKQASDQSSTAFGRMMQSAERNQQAWTAVGGTLTAVGVSVAALGAAAFKTGVEYNTLQQTSRAALTTLLGSAEAAADQMDRLDEFAKTSPFAKQTFITAQQQMLAFGIEARKVVPYLDSIQDAVAAAGGSNADIEAIVATMSKIQSSAKITAEDLNEFGNRGVNAAELIGSQMGMTGAEIREEITAGSLDATQALDSLAAGMAQNFDGAAENVKTTFAGAVDRVKAAWRDFSAELATPLVDPNGGGGLVDLLNWAADMMRAFENLPGPIKTTAGAVTGLSGAVSLLAGALLLGLPRLQSWNTNLKSFAAQGKAASVTVTALKASAGVAGVALTAAAVGFTIWAQNAAEARAQTEAWKATLDDFGNTTDATLNRINENLSQSRDIWYKFGEDQRSAIEIADQYGVAITDVQQAILGDAEAYDRVYESLEQYNSGLTLGTSASYLFQEGSERLLGTISKQREEIARSTTEKQRAAAADEAAGVAARQAAPSLEDVTAALDAQASAANDAYDALREYTNGALSTRSAARDMEAAIDDARKSIKDNGKTLDTNTSKGRENQAALDAIAQAGLNLVDAQREQGASEEELRGSMRKTRKSFIAAAEAAGMGRAEARALADQLGLIPKNIKPKVDVDTGNSTAEIDAVKSYLASLPTSKTITIQVLEHYRRTSETVYSATGPGGRGTATQRRATGGSVVGPGTGTSDSIPALLSNGEHVWTAREVAAAGGHGAVEAMRRAVLGESEPLELAAGGPVQPRTRSTTIQSLRMTVGAAS